MPPVFVDAPPEFKGRGGKWTPEHLFVASVNACLMMTFLAIAENSDLALGSFRSTASGELENVKGVGYQITEIVVNPRVVIHSAKDLGRAERILEKAKRNCFVSKLVKSLILVQPEIYNEQASSYPCGTVSQSSAPESSSDRKAG